MLDISTAIAVALAALVVGLWIKQTYSRIVLYASIGVIVVSALMLLVGNPYFAKIAGPALWGGLYFTAGMSGPALQDSPDSAIPVSVGAVLAMLLIGTLGVFVFLWASSLG